MPMKQPSNELKISSPKFKSRKHSVRTHSPVSLSGFLIIPIVNTLHWKKILRWGVTANYEHSTWRIVKDFLSESKIAKQKKSTVERNLQAPIYTLHRTDSVKVRFSKAKQNQISSEQNCLWDTMDSLLLIPNSRRTSTKPVCIGLKNENFSISLFQLFPTVLSRNE